MAFKLVVLSCLVAVASAVLVSPVAHYSSAPIHHHAHVPVQHYAPAPVKVVSPVKYIAQPEVYAPAEYNFQYSVHDDHTGDVKSQQEQRHGDDVQGSYSLLEADGTTRIVEYTASEKDGFNAVVRHEGHQSQAPAHIAKVAYAAPVAKVAYAAPIAKVAYAAPVAKVAYAAPIHHHYAAPVHQYVAPAVAKVAYAAPVVAKAAYPAYASSVTFSSPVASYHH